MADLDSVLDAALAGGGDPAPAADPPAPAPVAAADPTPAPIPAAPAAPAPAAEPDPFDTGADTFDRKYVEKLRTENAERRTRAKELEDRYGSAFDGVGDDEAAVWLDVVKTWKQDPTAVAEWMREQAEAILNGEQPPAPPAGQAGDQPLTRAEVEALLAQRDTAQQQQQMVAAVNKEVADLGLDPNSRGGKELMLRALEDHGGDIAAAHKAMQTEQAAFAQKAVDDYLAKKAEGAGAPAPVTSTGGAAPAPPVIKDAKSAAKALDAYLASQGMK